MVQLHIAVGSNVSDLPVQKGNWRPFYDFWLGISIYPIE